DTALDPAHRFQSAHASNVRRFARPRRHGSRTGHDDERFALALPQRSLNAGAVGQQSLQNVELLRRQGTLEIDEMDEARVQGPDRGLEGGETSEELGEPKRG